ncbi:UDP-N-acetyl-D-mannosamine dehydrogenase [Enterococcus villorum]|uniref:UDP-N-acetyl-D-mannosamine dehydrogenase n=1 Tax=Enterococcus villorum TaxID=112904 RepID=A0A1V8YGZ1_9ENTE|nr:nucleotide sugar dehydrogenase [Enterococcus villorum]OQO70744.1 UDP-N-acetyl-D-mannosamine dehydrogenase [Enterococcus villorum]OQO71874.1 UDP-N-acetyl-D-mannosamine dehydrogenase [Enterococcus villorum]
MKIVVVGLGYIGLPTALMFSKYGQKVVGIDVNQQVIESLNSGKVHIEEPHIQETLNEVVKNGNFKAKLKPEEADVFILSVPTPNLNDEHKSCDLSYVKQAVTSILEHLQPGNTVIVESTIPPRTMIDVVKPMIEAAGFVVGEDIFLVHCPERVLPGKIMHELIHNNRIIGGITEQCTEKGVEAYSTFVKGELIRTNTQNAEMSKLMENTFRDVNIALANELVQISLDLGVDALEVIEMANKHPRVNLHFPGPGVGGHCLAVDPYFVIAANPDKAQLIRSARKINTGMPEYVVQWIDRIMEEMNGQKVTLFGATYKGNTDDMRESPSVEIYEHLQSKKYEVSFYDPYVEAQILEKDIEKAVKNADLIVVLTDHDAFKELSPETLNHMNKQIIFDTKDIVEKYGEAHYLNFGKLEKGYKNIAMSTPEAIC